MRLPVPIPTLAESTSPAPSLAPYFFLSPPWISTRHLSTRDVPDGTLPTPPLHSLEEDKHFENTLAQLGEVDGEDPFMQVSPRPSIRRDTLFLRSVVSMKISEIPGQRP